MLDDPATLFLKGLQCHQAGELDEAELIYRKLLSEAAQAASAWHYLGVIALQRGHAAEALKCLHTAIAFDPATGTFHGNLGEALAALDLRSAVVCYERAIASDPTFASAYANLISRCQAVVSTERLVRLAHRHAALEPGSAVAQTNLGLLLCNQGLLAPAGRAAERAAIIEPASARIMSNLGRVYAIVGRQDKALARLEAATRLDPAFAGGHNNLGRARYRAGRIVDARTSLRRATALGPDLADAVSNLANVALALSDGQAATTLSRRVVALEPSSAAFHSNLVMALLYRDATTPTELFAAAVRGRAVKARPPSSVENRRKGKTTRPLRLGFVSADLRVHPVGDTLLTIVEAIDRTAANIFLYGNVMHPDAMTARFREIADRWRPIAGKDDDFVARQVRDDEVDVLISVAGHTADGRFPVFARRPAAVQVALFDLTSTGLAEIDYWIGDEITTPADTPELFSEALIRLPCWYVFRRPRSDSLPGPPPMTRSGHTTFGSFNNPAKLSPETVSIWAAIMRAVPYSRLLLKYLKAYEDAEVRRQIAARFSSEGVASDRIDFETGAVEAGSHLDVYNRVDIALDPFPFVGCNATFESLWMGVPVVTLRGSRFMSRVGAGFLPLVGLGQLVARDTADYVDIAKALTRNPAGLVAHREGLRDRVSKSRLCDAPAYAESLLAALDRVRRS